MALPPKPPVMNPEPPATVEDLAIIVRRLVRRLRTHNPQDDVARQAYEYLRRKGLQGNILRSE